MKIGTIVHTDRGHVRRVVKAVYTNQAGVEMALLRLESQPDAQAAAIYFPVHRLIVIKEPDSA